jgi:tetratricopeptide (TPR) repeat protein
MFGLGWLTLRQAQEALKGGRLDDAQRLLAQPNVQGYKHSWDTQQQLARAFAERGQKYLRQDNVAAAWADLLKAEQVLATEQTVIDLRHALTRLGLAEVRALLEVGEPGRALEAAAQLRDRAARPPDLEPLEDGAKHWTTARAQADRGEFAQALDTLQRVQRVLPAVSRAVERFLFVVHERQQLFHDRLPALDEAARGERWHEVLKLSEQLLAAAPQHVEVRGLRQRAWKAMEPATVVNPGPEVRNRPSTDNPLGAARSTPPGLPASKFLLWIDGVGGYLVCLGNRITLGQATPEATVDLPLFADVSRVHAEVTRDSEGYLLQGMRAVQVNGRTVERALLRNNDRITLGSCCQLQFRQAVPVSTSARLDLVSGHRLRVSVDGVLLMSDTLLLGPGNQVHVQMPDLQQPLVLFRQKDGLGIRTGGTLKINGHTVHERGVLEPGATVVGDDFSLTVEPVFGDKVTR